MQPLTLRAFDRAQKRILIINGYELTKDNQVRLFGTHYDRIYKPLDVLILRSTGIKDAHGEEIFETDVVVIHDQQQQIIGTVAFKHGAFILECKSKIITDWPPSTFLKRLDNFLVNPLALDAVMN